MTGQNGGRLPRRLRPPQRRTKERKYRRREPAPAGVAIHRAGNTERPHVIRHEIAALRSQRRKRGWKTPFFCHKIATLPIASRSDEEGKGGGAMTFFCFLRMVFDDS